MKNPFSYQGKLVVITGAFSGVGAATVEAQGRVGEEVAERIIEFYEALV